MRPRAAWVGAIYLQLRAKLIRTHESISFVSHTQIGPTHLGGPGVQPFKTPFRHRFTPPSPRRSVSQDEGNCSRHFCGRDCTKRCPTIRTVTKRMVHGTCHIFFFWRHRPGPKCAALGQAGMGRRDRIRIAESPKKRLFSLSAKPFLKKYGLKYISLFFRCRLPKRNRRQDI